MKTIYLVAIFITGLTTSQVSLGRDNTANIGDKLDDNNITASQELRVNEFPNRPDLIDKNKVPAKLEERQREEQTEPVDIEIGPKILNEEKL